MQHAAYGKIRGKNTNMSKLVPLLSPADCPTTACTSSIWLLLKAGHRDAIIHQSVRAAPQAEAGRAGQGTMVWAALDDSAALRLLGP